MQRSAAEACRLRDVRETVLALGLFVLLSGGAIAIQGSSVSQLLWTGGGLVVGGLAFSVPCAVRYHLLLHRALSSRNALDRWWLLNPTAHHVRLTRPERAHVLPWFYAGAVGWALSLSGALLLGGVAIWIS